MPKRNHLTFCLLLCSILFLPTAVLAKSQKSITFEDWLEKYGAWDQLEKEYSEEADKDTPDVILKRAEVYLNLNSPKQALEIVEMTQSFDDNATEARRLWLGGQSHRALGDLSKSVLWFSQSAEHIDNDSDLRKFFKSEVGLEEIWMDVWLKMYWSYSANHTLSRNAQQDALLQIGDIGKNVWGGSYWEKTTAILTPTDESVAAKPEPLKLDKNGLPLPPFISKQDMDLVIKALASVSLEKFDDALTHVSAIEQPPVRFFWISVVEFFRNGSLPEDLSALIDGNYLKARAFWQGNILAPYSASRSAWVLGNPDSGPWTKFRNNILAMSSTDAAKAIDNELGSMLISEQTATLLNSFKLALSMSNGDFINAASTWNKIDKRNLPLALQVGGLLLFKDNLNNVLPNSPIQSFKVYPVLAALSGAAGYDVVGNNEAPFWIAAQQNQLKNLAKADYPMDKLLLLAYWQQVFDSKPTMTLAKRAAFLFDGTAFGTESLLFLADQSVKNKKLQLGAFYLNAIKNDELDKFHKVTWLDIKTRLELDSGRNAAALKTYKEMAAIDVEVPVMTRLRMALLFQQRRDFDAAREELLILWNNRASMTTTLQAETLFWLGEGEQALRNSEKALDYYLKLAWQYPQENIWALTAMYRASLIYEKRGKYDTAKRLLTTVVKRADRKEQREAAKARINAIDKKMGKGKSDKAKSVLVYPF